MVKIIMFLLCILIIRDTNAQANDAEALLYNISIGGVLGAVGAIINKKPDEQIKKVVLKGLSQGLLGGYLTFESKRLLRVASKNEDWKYIWGAKLLNAGGTSIKENAAMNRNFWEKWHINIGFSRIEFETKGKFKIRNKIMPIVLIFIADAFFRFNKFELEQSLKIGEFMFSENRNNLRSGGAALAGYFVVDNQRTTDFRLLTHEITHLYQSNDFMIFNSYFQKPLNKWATKSKTVNFLNKYTFFDLHFIPLRTLYLIEKNRANTYYDNFFEHEAQYYSR